MSRALQHYLPRRKLLLLASETALLTGIFATGAKVQLGGPTTDTRTLPQEAGSALVAAAICQLVMAFQDLYDWRISAQSRERNPRLVAAGGILLVRVRALLVHSKR